MTIFNLGSINADHVYRVEHLPEPGETLAAISFKTGLGGKGANQSVAAARAGSDVVHIGAVGDDGAWAIDRIAGYGVDIRGIATVSAPTGHAIINVDSEAENTIILYSGANREQAQDEIIRAMDGAAPEDILMLQNETSHQAFAAKHAAARGMRVFYSAAPFEVDAVREMLPFITYLALNAVESEQLCAGLETDLANIDVPVIIVTRGAEGAEWREAGAITTAPAFRVEAVDTTGAGDTFAGYVAAALDQGISPVEAMHRASAASAIKVTRQGAADAIPMMDEVATFMALNR